MARSIPLWMLAILVTTIDPSACIGQGPVGPAQASSWTGPLYDTKDPNQASLGEGSAQTSSDNTVGTEPEPDVKIIQASSLSARGARPTPPPTSHTYQIQIGSQTGNQMQDVSALPQSGTSQDGLNKTEGKTSLNDQPRPLAINPASSTPTSGDSYRKYYADPPTGAVPQSSFVPPIRIPDQALPSTHQLIALPGSSIPVGSLAARRTAGSNQEPADAPAAENLPIPQEQAPGAAVPEDVTLGEEPEDPTPYFLRQESVLLDPGELQVDFTIQYLNDASDGFLATVVNNNLIIGEVERTQRLLLTPLEFRLGIRNDAQLFVNIPIGWSNSEVLFNGEDNFANSGGIGDISIGWTKLRCKGVNGRPDFLTTCGLTIPSGDSNLLSSFETPGSQLGTGHWALFSAATWIKTYDPVAFFYGFGTVYRVEHSFENGVTVEPGLEMLYRMGVGFAVNSNVTFSTTFQGSYIFDTTVEDVRIAGSYLEPMTIRLASTIGRTPSKDCRKGCCCVRCKSRPKIIEPFVTFGITEDANDAVIGISCTY